MKTSTLSASLMSLVCMHVAGCVSMDQARSSARGRGIEEAAEALEVKADADSLAASALLRAGERKPEMSLELLTRATIVSPDRPDLAWLRIQVCRTVPGCDSSADEQRLRILALGNGAARLPALALADKAGDEATQLSTLSALAHADHIDLYWTTLIIHLARPVIATGRISSQEALTEVIGVLAAEAVPAYRTISQLCVGARLDDPVTLHDCRSVALALERGDTDITEMVGVNIAQRLWRQNSPEWAAANGARRAHEYRTTQLASAGKLDFADNRAADEFLALCAHNHREQDVEIAELVAVGKSPIPPEEWAP
jgi:hypothetical protein